MKKSILILSMALLSLCASAQHDHASGTAEKATSKQMAPMFEDQNMGLAYGAYIQLKEALVASESKSAATAAAGLQKSLAAVDNSKSALAEAAKVAKAATLDDRRKAFVGLSNEMTALVKGAKLSMGTIYLDYCPMAKGSWLSNDKEIKNPYYGSKMLSCGSVKETIE
ncbi:MULTISPECIES: DUF3347 domain-containing protein [unclassified Imperialibacter]|uniref:DUF3347 domain-containing protein n=1 Tax=unclassified Imperialibacter TaxID=2629706 RepID=UPI00125A87D6|nr:MULTISPECIES: DUF3347 domain-containing protein [unclassified Imperialibacter]CAD5264685.1 conserved exported hypothetical protein [Imperialibacter sp. 89]CAD5269582.1 conserved exported hypothetical protein [Imperialibacter sp. 75]VVT09197.1 conserved exported hypothetical protein [Imperialibacter sp. EC-SDR9]